MMKCSGHLVSCLLAVATWLPVSAQESAQEDDIKELKLRDWKPRSMMKTRVTEVEKPAFPVIDVHNHLGGGASQLTPERVRQYLEEMDAAGVRTVVNLDGGWGTRLEETLAALDEAHPVRFLTRERREASLGSGVVTARGAPGHASRGLDMRLPKSIIDNCLDGDRMFI